MSVLQRISAQALGESGHRKNALQSIVWGCAVLSSPIICAILYRGIVDIIAGIAFTIAAIPPILLVVGFLFFMWKDPDRLQSEGFQLKRQALELIEEKGTAFPVDATSIQRISDPNGSHTKLSSKT